MRLWLALVLGAVPTTWAMEGGVLEGIALWEVWGRTHPPCPVGELEGDPPKESVAALCRDRLTPEGEPEPEPLSGEAYPHAGGITDPTH